MVVNLSNLNGDDKGKNSWKFEVEGQEKAKWEGSKRDQRHLFFPLPLSPRSMNMWRTSDWSDSAISATYSLSSSPLFTLAGRKTKARRRLPHDHSRSEREDRWNYPYPTVACLWVETVYGGMSEWPYWTKYIGNRRRKKGDHDQPSCHCLCVWKTDFEQLSKYFI